MKIPGLSTLRRLTIQPVENAMNLVFLSVVKKFLASTAKSVLAALIAGFSLFLGAPPPTDAAGIQVWAVVLLGIRTLISVIGQLIVSLDKPKPAA